MAGYIEPGYLPAVKADGNYIFVRSTFATRSRQDKAAGGKGQRALQEEVWHDMSENAARSFMAPFVLADAINRAKSTNPDAIFKALNETNIPGNQLINPWQGIKFDRKRTRTSTQREHWCRCRIKPM